MNSFLIGFEKRAMTLNYKKGGNAFVKAFKSKASEATPSSLVYGKRGAVKYDPGGKVSTKGPAPKPVYVP